MNRVVVSRARFLPAASPATKVRLLEQNLASARDRLEVALEYGNDYLADRARKAIERLEGYLAEARAELED